MLFLPFLKRPVFCGAVLEHFQRFALRRFAVPCVRDRCGVASTALRAAAPAPPHRSPYCLCARSLGNFTEKCPSCRATRFFLRCTCATPTSRRTCAFVGSGGCKQSSNIGVCAFGTTG